MVVDVNMQTVPEHGRPHVLFPVRLSRSGLWNYDVTPDGQRFAMNLALGDDLPKPISVVLNWALALPR
jgi:hypothetical protein